MELEPPGIIPPDDDPVRGRDPFVDRVESALDAGKEEEAFELAEGALAKGDGNRLDLLFLAGDALLALGRPAEAEQKFRTVLADDPDCPSSRCWLAMSLYRQCRFEEAEVECARALAADRPAVDAHVVRGLLLERRGRYAEADACFVEAAEQDAERFREPVRMTRTEFDREVRKAARKLPRQFRSQLDRVPVVVHDLPSLELLTRDGTPLDPDLLGLFDGIPLPDTGELGGAPAKPNYIYLFQRNLERFARDRADLVEQISITLYHELGHYLGFEEEEMDDLGLA
jgi:predicted Zn-dependent protease with MMP-like domain